MMEPTPALSRLEALPLSLRMNIFRYAVYPASPNTLVCCWVSSLPQSFISNIFYDDAHDYIPLSYPHNVKRYTSTYRSLSLVNLLFNLEVVPLFYADHTFRVNTKQLKTLLRKQQILREIHRLEIENVWSEAVDVLSSLISKLVLSAHTRNIDHIVLGVRCWGTSLPSVETMIRRQILYLWLFIQESIRNTTGRLDLRILLAISLQRLRGLRLPRLQTTAGLTYSQLTFTATV